MKTLLFKVISPGGHEYKVFTDGSIEGFPPNSWVVNHSHSFAAQEVIDSTTTCSGVVSQNAG